MLLTETKLPGAFVVDPDTFADDRGLFVRCWSALEFSAHGLDARLVETNLSVNRRQGTLRGMHFQIAPYAQATLVRCAAGAIYDVIVDLRPESATFKQWATVELTSENRRQIYVPEGFAHGFQTLAPHTEVFYQMSAHYAAEGARGVRWDDPAFGIVWPDADRIIIERDRRYADFAG